MSSRAATAAGSDYAELKRRLSAAGLFEAQPLYYGIRLTLTFALLGFGIAFLLLSPWLWADLVGAAFLGLVAGQFGFVMHDTAHRQIFPPGRRADVLLLVSGMLLNGVSGVWWKRKHDLHHAHPNDTEHDPDVRISLLAFTEEQARSKSRLIGIVTRYQAYLIFPLFAFEAFQLRGASVKHLVTKRARLRKAEALLMAVHVAGYCALFIVAVGWPGALAAILIREAVSGLYMGSVFAPNHKGMPMVGSDSDLSFLERQVVTARNVRGGRLLDWWYGGLNYQIEHHLFPTLPQNRLRQARLFVKAFCAERGIPYLETSLWDSYRQLVSSLDTASMPLRGDA